MQQRVGCSFVHSIENGEIDYSFQGRASEAAPQLGIGAWRPSFIQRNWPLILAASSLRRPSTVCAAFSGSSPPVASTQRTHLRYGSASGPILSASVRIEAHIS